METSPMIFFANQWTSLYMITASVMKELILEVKFDDDSLATFQNPDGIKV